MCKGHTQSLNKSLWSRLRRRLGTRDDTNTAKRLEGHCRKSCRLLFCYGGCAPKDAPDYCSQVNSTFIAPPRNAAPGARLPQKLNTRTISLSIAPPEA